MHDGVGLTDVGQELVAQPLALGRAGDQARDVHDLDRGRQDLVRPDKTVDRVQIHIRDGSHRHVGLDGAEGEVPLLGPSRGQGIEEGTFANIGQTDDSTGDAHAGEGSERPRRSPPPGASNQGDAVDLDSDVLREAADLDRGAGGRLDPLEGTGIDLIDHDEVVHIGQEDGAADGALEARPGGGQDGVQILDHLDRLLRHAALDDLHRAGIQRDLAGAVDHAPGDDRLVVGADGAGSVGGRDGLTFLRHGIRGGGAGLKKGARMIHELEPPQRRSGAAVAPTR